MSWRRFQSLLNNLSGDSIFRHLYSEKPRVVEGEQGVNHFYQAMGFSPN
jgi:hypothetical protein